MQIDLINTKLICDTILTDIEYVKEVYHIIGDNFIKLLHCIY